MLKGQFLPGVGGGVVNQAEAGGSGKLMRNPLRMCIHDPLSPQGPPLKKVFLKGQMSYCGSPLPTRTIFFCFFSKKYHYGSLSVGLPVLKTPSSVVDTVLVLQNL